MEIGGRGRTKTEKAAPFRLKSTVRGEIPCVYI
uniref:Uncharacterized protein n=1 Tax=Siphoviridae sp. ctjbm8 TaxID=2825634 RepID=A0A8S5VG35_9CAUD|nr:MAG TPA: hypothetical protein [Siphoviridae sp. ctjbm8]